VLVAIAVFFALPLAWLGVAAVDPRATVRASWPAHPGLANFRAIMTEETTFRPLWNGVLLCGGSALITMVVATLAAYPLSRHTTMRFRGPFLYTTLFATGLPVTAIMIPVYELFVRINLIDSMAGTAMFLAATSTPFAIFLLKGFMDGVPKDLEEAAWTDGANATQALRHIIVPLIAPGMAVVAIFTFIIAWANFYAPFLLLYSAEKQPASVAIYSLFGERGQVNYGELAAYSMLYSLPVLMLYVVVSRVLGGQFAFTGAVKG
jgi:multiple sugar transport system permease protein